MNCLCTLNSLIQTGGKVQTSANTTRVYGSLGFTSNKVSVTWPTLLAFTYSSFSGGLGLNASSNNLYIDGANYPGKYIITFTIGYSPVTQNLQRVFYIYVTSPAIYYPGGSGTQYFSFCYTVQPTYNGSAMRQHWSGMCSILCTANTTVQFYGGGNGSSPNQADITYTNTMINIARVTT